MNNFTGEEFLSRLFRDMHNEKSVLKSSNSNDSKYVKIRKYLSRLENVHNEALRKDRLSLLKKYYYDKYVIKKENISDDHFNYLEIDALNRGHGHIKYDKGILSREKDVIISDQKRSLDVWIDYFVSDDSRFYPMWFKYYVFQSIVKMGSFDKEKNIYNQRTEKTVSVFPELNREALSLIYDYFNKVLNNNKNYVLSDSELETLIKSGSFKKIYAYVIKKLLMVEKIEAKSNEGIWIKYNQGEDHLPLVKSLEGKGTGWCTAGEGTAKEQLSGGDFYVYYTRDYENKYTIPRIAIRMEENSIAEIRGIEKNQNLEPEMEMVVDEKLKEFPDGNLYKKKINDMSKLTNIYNKYLEGKFNYSLDEIKFLYQIEFKIEGFGYEEDPRIKEILQGRNRRVDLSKVLNCEPDYIILKSDYNVCPDIEYISDKNTIYFEGDLNVKDLDKDFKLPKYVSGDLTIECDNLKGVELPIYVGGDLCLDSLKTLENVKFPEFIGGSIYLTGLKSINDYKFPEIVYGVLDISNVENMRNVVLPKTINSDCNISSLKNYENVMFPNNIIGGLLWNKLDICENFKFPEFIGLLSLMKLEKASNVIFPKKVKSSVDLHSLNTIVNVTFPEEVGGFFELTSLENTENLLLPKSVGDLCLFSIKSASGLKIPKIKNRLFLNHLETLEGLDLPDDFDLNKVFINDKSLKQELISKQNKKL